MINDNNDDIIKKVSSWWADPSNEKNK
ncbi:unnamed protein product [Spirodela intermedia]|uniref:Uncharacterized protein n=2 Tax=Spirodela intermedia TaxID=51605 RepID=A0A7I8JU39_SPIIN|nr:unnamed protein product [Spirodela intermedia]CAA6673624.1 unnamed protein product [Spirodela intermedia]CAA7410866.1 unnamed protein product [Spirodela intermedia]